MKYQMEKPHTYSNIRSLQDFVKAEEGYAVQFIANYGDEVTPMQNGRSVKKCAKYRKEMNEYLFSLSEEELRQVSLEKAPNGCSTERANFAQRMIWHKVQYGCYCTC